MIKVFFTSVQIIKQDRLEQECMFVECKECLVIGTDVMIIFSKSDFDVVPIKNVLKFISI